VLPGGQSGGLGDERHRRCHGAASAERTVNAPPGHGTAAHGGAGAEQEPAPRQPRELRDGRPGSRHDTGFQWNVKLTVCGLSHTSWYSRWRADTGGETRRVSV
jgi:hypothetical protein